MWAGHNREYGLLKRGALRGPDREHQGAGQAGNAGDCPAGARAIPIYDFEVICGARRHWTISWLRSHNYPDFKFLIDVREIGDEEAFRLADIENRARDDLTDLERARDYLRALDAYYEGPTEDDGRAAQCLRKLADPLSRSRATSGGADGAFKRAAGTRDSQRDRSEGAAEA